MADDNFLISALTNAAFETAITGLKFECSGLLRGRSVTARKG